MSIRSTGSFGAAPGAARSSVLLAAAALAVLAVGAARAQTSATERYPITREQRQTADQVASSGVPLSALSPSAPDRYTVKPGDTLWGISSIYLISPWRWPELWGMNRQQVRNPHLIYPGQTLVLVKGNGRAQLQLANGGQPGDLVRLSPRVRDVGNGDLIAIASIPNNLIEPFLSQPLVVGADDLDSYPRLVATQEARVYLGRDDLAYARGVSDDAVENYHVFRPATPLYEPDDTDHKKPIAYEARFLGSMQVTKRGEVTTLRVTDSKEEIGVGDRLVPITRDPLVRYVPHQPDHSVDGRVIAIYNALDLESSLYDAGTQDIVTLDRGSRDGLEVGHVLALLHNGPTVRDETVSKKEYVKLPDERIGEMFVFRVFEGISYGLILRTTDSVKIGDRFTSPDDAAAAPMAAAVH